MMPSRQFLMLSSVSICSAFQPLAGSRPRCLKECFRGSESYRPESFRLRPEYCAKHWFGIAQRREYRDNRVAIRRRQLEVSLVRRGGNGIAPLQLNCLKGTRLAEHDRNPPAGANTLEEILGGGTMEEQGYGSPVGRDAATDGSRHDRHVFRSAGRGTNGNAALDQGGVCFIE